MKHSILMILLAFLPILTSAQSVVITESLKMINNSQADVMYANEFGSFKNMELDDEFPYCVIRIMLEGDVSRAKEMLSLDVGLMYKVEARILNKDNMILFLIKSNVRNISLLCGDGCRPQQLHYGNLINNKVYTANVKYEAKKQSDSSTKEITEIKKQNELINKEMEEIKKQNQQLLQSINNQQTDKASKQNINRDNNQTAKSSSNQVAKSSSKQKADKSNQTAKSKESKSEGTVSESLPSGTWYSNQFKLFWSDFVYEVNKSNKPLKKFKPSAEFVEFYALAKDKKNYVLTGYIQTKGNEFDAEAVRAKGVTVNEMISGVYSFRCPLYLLPELVNTPGMKILEAGKKLDRLYK